jgi:hypothetical protein
VPDAAALGGVFWLAVSYNQYRGFGVGDDTRGIGAKQKIAHSRVVGANGDEVGFHFFGRFKDARVDVSPADAGDGFELFGHILANESIHHLGELLGEFFGTVIRKVLFDHRFGHWAPSAPVRLVGRIIVAPAGSRNSFSTSTPELENSLGYKRTWTGAPNKFRFVRMAD